MGLKKDLYSQIGKIVIKAEGKKARKKQRNRQRKYSKKY